MARYELLQKAFIDVRVHEAGETVTVADDVIPGPYMKPLDKAAIAAFRKYKQHGAPMRNMDDAPVAQFETFDIGELAHASA
jgi:hypothetical protein